MKLIINRNNMVDVLGKIQGLTGRRSSLAITECVLLRAENSKIHISATDLESGYDGSFPSVVEGDGVIAISARKLYEIVREFPSSDILMNEGENRKITIGNQKISYNLRAMNPDDFPEHPVINAVDFFEVDSAVFKKMIEKSIVISGIGEDKKPHINGAWFERLSDHQPATLRIVSTDGSRMSKYDLHYKGQIPLPSGSGVLIPKKGLHEIVKFLPGAGNIQVGIQGSYFVVKSENETFYIRLLEGVFPKYEEIVTRSEGNIIQMDKELFLNMLKRMSILCNDSYRAALFRFEPGILTINATNPDLGESKEDTAIEFNDRIIEAAFNPKYFIDAINGIDDKKVSINILSEDKPCLIHGAEGKVFLSVIMPMRV